ncbi:MAG: GDSL-type esterase/lipase family protein [Oscillospiraceae bacterium]
MKKRTGLLLMCALLAALLLSGCSGQKRAEYRADVQSGVSYLQSLETIDPDTVTQKLRQMRLEKLQAERAAREQALLDDIDTVWQEFSDAVILGDSRAVGFSYYSFLDASRVLASSGERIDAIDGHIEDLKKLDPAYIFLCYGINDLGWYGSAQDYADTLLEKIRLLRRELPEAVIVVSSILPAYEPAVSREKLWLQIPDYTAAVQAMCEENGVLFADNTQLSEDYADLWQPDGIHLLPEFYPHWAANLIFASWGRSPMRKRFFLGAGRWLTAIAIGFCLFRLLWDGAAAGVPFDTVTAAVVQSVDLSQTKTADGQMLRRLYGLDPAEYAGCALYYPAGDMGVTELLAARADGRSA